MNHAFSAVVFDTFGTLVDWRGSLIRELTAFGALRGLAADWAALVDDWRAGYQPAMSPIRKGQRAFVSLDVLHREVLERLIEKYQLQALSETDRIHINAGWHRLDPWVDVVPGLEVLKRSLLIAPMSNGNTALLTNMAKRAGMPWDTVLGADVFGVYKPSPEAYLGMCRFLDLRPERVLMVAAHGGDLIAAKACGLGTCFVPRPLEFGAAHGRAETFEGADIAAGDIADLASRLAPK